MDGRWVYVEDKIPFDYYQITINRKERTTNNPLHIQIDYNQQDIIFRR